ncbi:MAG: hypothetical protein WA962_09015 [Ornithinimicrobium sp.]
MMSAFFVSAAEGEHSVNELWFEPIWFGVIAALVFAGLLALLWGFRNTLALDPHVDHDGDDDGTAQGQHSADGGPGPIKGQASQH